MANEIEKFDPSKLMNGVKDRIKATFVSLIPDDMWNAMVEKEIYIFTTGKIIPHHDCDYSKKDENGNYIYNDWEERIPYSDKDEYDSWGHVKNPAEISPLRRMIRDSLQEKFQQNLKEFLDGDEYRCAFDQYGKPEISKAIKKILIDNSDTIFVNFMSTIMQSAFSRMRCEVASDVQQILQRNY